MLQFKAQAVHPTKDKRTAEVVNWQLSHQTIPHLFRRITGSDIPTTAATTTANVVEKKQNTLMITELIHFYSPRSTLK